jgi:hypothetical protein
MPPLLRPIQGKSSSSLWMAWSSMWLRTSASHACGSTPLRRVVWISAHRMAARSPSWGLRCTTEIARSGRLA